MGLNLPRQDERGEILGVAVIARKVLRAEATEHRLDCNRSERRTEW